MLYDDFIGTAFDKESSLIIICPMVQNMEENHRMWIKIIEEESLEKSISVHENAACEVWTEFNMNFFIPQVFVLNFDVYVTSFKIPVLRNTRERKFISIQHLC